MTTLTIRKLNIDLSGGFPRHWHGGDAFRSQYYNALSMSFPVGEQYFMDSVRAGAALLPQDAAHQPLQELVRGFIGQEATHRHVHALYNTQLEKQGLINIWARAASWRIEKSRKLHVLHHLAVTAGYEHCTAVFAEGTLRYASWFDAAEPGLRTLWRWHAVEETEHRAVAFDVYQALGGGTLRRSLWFAYVLVLFSLDAGVQTTLNLWRDKTLFRPSTWWSALTFFFGQDGAVWRCTLPLLAYFSPWFHPGRHQSSANGATGDALAGQWLAAHTDQWRVVGKTTVEAP